MYASLKRQRGLGWFGLLFVFGTIGFFAIIAVKVGPLYMNHTTVLRVVKGIADNPDYANASPQEIRDTLQKRWDVDYISHLKAGDVKIKRGKQGRMLSYDYEAKVNVFYNLWVVVKFKDDHPMKPGGGDIDS